MLLALSPTVALCRAVLTLLVAGTLLETTRAATPFPPTKVEIAAAISLTGDTSAYGRGSLEGIQLAVEDANGSGLAPRIELKIHDDESSSQTAARIASQIVASRAVLVVGPSNTTTSLAAGPIFAQAGIPSITTTASSDLITGNATTFRILFKNSEQGEMLARYLIRVLQQKRAAVLVADGGYGRTLEKGFRTAAERLGIETKYYVFKPGENAEEIARSAASEIGQMPIILAMLDSDGAKVLRALRQVGVNGPFLGGDAFGIETFNSHFAESSEDRRQPGYFCEELYGITPMLLDSANADVLSFAERFKARFGHNPAWLAVTGYDAARAAIEAVRVAAAETNSNEPAELRPAALKYLQALNDPREAPNGLLGPLVFDADRGRHCALRIGRFNRGRLESAPVQIVSVLNPHEEDLKSGAVSEMSPGRYVRLQQVIYTGIHLNEIMWLEQVRSTFAADFYVWLRFATNQGAEVADPTDIKFPDLLHGGFDREHPVERREMLDGTSYYLWRVQGEFRNNFNLHRYPFDRQTLNIRFVNSRAAADRIVYALDPGVSQSVEELQTDQIPFGTAATAFDKLSQWKFLGAHQLRENFVARSSLGDPRRLGRENFRELSGYLSSIELQRRAAPTLTKNLLPLFIMTAILYASLHFPSVLVQPKIGVAMTAVLTGMVLLNLVNSQLGMVGYTVAVEYAFYVFFTLGFLHVVSVLLSEHLREIGKPGLARRTDVWSRLVFLSIVAIFLFAAAVY